MQEKQPEFAVVSISLPKKMLDSVDKEAKATFRNRSAWIQMVIASALESKPTAAR